jgi:hypothetical protein
LIAKHTLSASWVRDGISDLSGRNGIIHAERVYMSRA